MISVILTAYEGERFLAEAIDSVRAQTLAPHEILVVDDGSTDGSGDVARARGVRVLRQDNAGQGAALNAGIAATTGDLVAFLDQDDVWLPDKLAIQVRALADDVHAVFGHAVEFRDADAPPGVLPRPGPRPAPLPSAMLIRRSALAELGGFDVARGVVAAADLVARARHAGMSLHMLPDVVFRRRLHANNLGVRQQNTAAYLDLVRAAVRRRDS